MVKFDYRSRNPDITEGMDGTTNRDATCRGASLENSVLQRRTRFRYYSHHYTAEIKPYSFPYKDVTRLWAPAHIIIIRGTKFLK